MSDHPPSDSMVTLLNGEQVTAKRLLAVSASLEYLLTLHDTGQKVLDDLHSICVNNQVPATLHPEVRGELIALELLNDDAIAPRADARAIVLQSIDCDPETGELTLKSPHKESSEPFIDSTKDNANRMLKLRPFSRTRTGWAL